MCVSANHQAREINQRGTFAPVLLIIYCATPHATGIILPGAAS